MKNIRSLHDEAMQCGRYREGEQLVARALSGDPTPEIAKELRDLLQQIYAASETESDMVTYEVRFKHEESSNIEMILKHLGKSAHAIYKAVGGIVL